jgi:hypothetical protein
MLFQKKMKQRFDGWVVAVHVEIQKQGDSVFYTREPLINYAMSLRVLKRAATRRASQRMARFLCKKCNAVDVRFRTRPVGLTG